MTLFSFEAKFYDGKKVKSYQVLVKLYRSKLYIKTIDKSLKINWPYKEIKILEQPMPPQPARLTFRKTPNARLYIEAGENWRFLKAKLPKSAFPSISLSTSCYSLIGYAGLSGIFILGAVLFGPKLFEYASHMIPQSTEKQIGQLAIKSAINDSVCAAPQGQASLEKMVQNLQQGMKRNIAFNVHVVPDDETLKCIGCTWGASGNL